jgi:hypothetical protein
VRHGQNAGAAAVVVIDTKGSSQQRSPPTGDTSDITIPSLLLQANKASTRLLKALCQGRTDICQPYGPAHFNTTVSLTLEWNINVVADKAPHDWWLWTAVDDVGRSPSSTHQPTNPPTHPPTHPPTCPGNQRM